MAEGDRIVSAIMAPGCTITPTDVIEMGPKIIANLKTWCGRHGLRLVRHGDGYVVEAERARSVSEMVTRFITMKSTAA